MLRNDNHLQRAVKCRCESVSVRCKRVASRLALIINDEIATAEGSNDSR